MKKKIQMRSALTFVGGITAGFGFLAALNALLDPENSTMTTAVWVGVCTLTAWLSFATITFDKGRTCEKSIVKP